MRYPLRRSGKRVCVVALAAGTRGPWRRRGGGGGSARKRFRYVNASGAEIRDEEQLERIRALAIPPAWRGRLDLAEPASAGPGDGDRRGRAEAVPLPRELSRRPRAREVRAACSTSRRRCPTLRDDERHAICDGDAYEQDWTCALAVGLVNKAWFRVGSDRHTRRSRTYGVTTLTKRHVCVDGDEVQFRFRAKNRRLVRRTDPEPDARARRRAVCSSSPAEGGSSATSATASSIALTGAAAQRVPRGEHGRGLHREGLPDLGRDAASPRRSSRARELQRTSARRRARSRRSCDRSATSSATRPRSRGSRTSARR